MNSSALLLGGVRVVGNHQPNLSMLAGIVPILALAISPRAKRSVGRFGRDISLRQLAVAVMVILSVCVED